MVVPSPRKEAEAPAATRADAGAAVRQPRKSKLTGAQRRARRAAVATLADEGFRPLRLRDYDVDHRLRVLIGRPAGDKGGPRRAFFFARRRFVGFDSDAPSASLRVAGAKERSVTLAYGMYVPGDRRCCPTGGTERVRFVWNGSALAPQAELPDPFVRVPIR